MYSKRPALSIQPDRLLADHAALATIGSSDTHGITRLAYTQQHQNALSWLADMLEQIGMVVEIDALGNVEARSRDENKDRSTDIISGSHLDTVFNGGAYDGALGVISALEALRTLRASDPTLPVGMIAFSTEESTRFGVGCIGSRGMVGELKEDDLDQYVDDSGITLREALSAVGLNPSQLSTARRKHRWARTFLEIHIDQGRELYEAGCPIGIVKSIAGPLRLRATVEGVACHSGATPMNNRRDALISAAEIILAIERIALDLEASGAWGTVGDVKVEPGAFNTVPGLVQLDIEIRTTRVEMTRRATDLMERAFKDVDRNRGTQTTWKVISQSEPVVIPPWLVDVLEGVCEELGIPYIEMDSRPAHDAMYVSKLAPTGMILVRNSSGLSHSPFEVIDDDDFVIGATVLANTMYSLAIDAQGDLGELADAPEILGDSSTKLEDRKDDD